MKVLAAISDAKERKRIAAVLVAAHHEVVEAATAVAAAGMLQGAFDIALVDVGLVGRARAAPNRVYVIAVVSATAASSDYWTAYNTGADDVMRITATKDELGGRVAALARIRTWAAPRRSVTQRIASLSIWSNVVDVVAGSLGELIGEPFVLDAGSGRLVESASSIPLTLTTEEIQLRIGLGIDLETMAALQATLLGGDTSPDAVADAMREIANTAAGGIKRAGLDNGVEFTIGLPSNTNILACEATTAHRSWTLRSASGVSFTCVAIALSNAPKLIATRDLREGMVLARDVRNAMGVLIAPAGTNITRTTVEQLGRLLGATANLEVNEMAA
jgi:DNA-binding response OmpR family regulator